MTSCLSPSSCPLGLSLPVICSTVLSSICFLFATEWNSQKCRLANHKVNIENPAWSPAIGQKEEAAAQEGSGPSLWCRSWKAGWSIQRRTSHCHVVITSRSVPASFIQQDPLRVLVGTQTLCVPHSLLSKMSSCLKSRVHETGNYSSVPALGPDAVAQRP